MKRRLRRATLALCSLAALVAAVPSSGAAATTIVAQPGDNTPYAAWVDQAAVPTPDAVVKIVRDENCRGWTGGLMGCAEFEPMKATGVIHLTPDASGEVLRKVFYHELGHIFDDEYIYPADRPGLISALGFPAGSTWIGSQVGSINPQEWFAEAATVCSFGRKPPYQSYEFRWGPKDPQVRYVCDFMRTAVTRPARVLSTFSIKVPAKRKFTGTMRVVDGTLSASLKLGKRTWRSEASCTDRLGGAKRFAFVNTCGTRLVVGNRGSSTLRFTYRAVPNSLSSDPRLGTFSRIPARK